MHRALIALPVLALLAVTQTGAAKPAAKPRPVAAAANPARDLLAGVYKVDPDHTTILFRVGHVGMSHFTGQFRRFDAHLTLDPKTPKNTSVTAEIDVASLATPVVSVPDFDKEISGKDWLDAPGHPKMTFRSTKVTMTGVDTATVVGDFTLRGITKPVTLKAKFNGGYAANSFDPSGSRIGFSATGSFKRSDFGVTYGIPTPGSNMGVSDAVQVIIEAEFTMLPAKK